MGSEDLFHKRKAKKQKEFERKKARRKSYERVLIVCEGEKTEPFYFMDLRNYYKLSTTNVCITGECGSAPKTIVEHAKKMYKESAEEGNKYDKVFCVFDKDSHDSYDFALEIISKLKPYNTFQAITSVPCFEYWLLLHFEFTTKPFHGTDNLSPANQLVKEDLSKHIPNYQKAQKKIFTRLFPSLEAAINNAEKANNQAEQSGTDSPTTNVPDLVQYLIKLEKQ